MSNKSNDDDISDIKFVLLGHVDHGKSTLAGRILYDSGYIEEREVEKLKTEADMNKKSTWWLSYILDVDTDERLRGKTHSYVYIPFKHKNKTLELIDVPGHRLLVSEMIAGTSRADIGVVVISIRKGEYEQGLSGQTIEHIMVARGMGLLNIIVAINKMDTIDWDYDKYKELVTKLEKKLKMMRFDSITFIPISGYDGSNVSKPLEEGKNKLFNTSCLLDTIYDHETRLKKMILEKNSKKEINKFEISNKNTIPVKMTFFKFDGVIAQGVNLIIHSDDNHYESVLIILKNGKYKFVTKDNMIDKENKKLNKILGVLKLENPPKLISKKLILRLENRTVGYANILDKETFKKEFKN
uniref:Tr-type G domain-containing protein n=1 Tax=viral metagenome TaxID=1070528 RepID=A0A6C0ACJ2_9ZZZZ